MRNYTCPSRYECQNYGNNRCEGCNDFEVNFNKPEKKMVLVGVDHRGRAFNYMNTVISNLTESKVDITCIDHTQIRFETVHTKVWFIFSVGQLRGLDGIRADAVFREAFPEIEHRMATIGGIISRSKYYVDLEGLIDYICRVERDATRCEDNRPKTYITTAGDQYDEFRKRMLNYTYGKFGLGADTDGYYFVDLNGRKPEKVEFLWGRQNGKTQARLKYLERELGKIPEKQINFGGENNMTKEERDYIRRDNELTHEFWEEFMKRTPKLGHINISWPTNKLPGIKNVIFSGPCTIVMWEDGTKTIVRCEKDVLDPEKGLAMAIAKKALGTNKSGSNYYDIFKKWLPKEEEPIVIDFEEAQNNG